MKADRRHELRENDLEHGLRYVGDYLTKNGKTIGLLVVLVIAVVGGATIIMGQKAAAEAGAWVTMQELASGDNIKDAATADTSLTELAELRSTMSGRDYELASLITQIDVALQKALDAEESPNAALNEHARKACEELLRKYSKTPIAFGAAHCGLATVEENAFVLDGDLKHKEAAREHLTAVINHAPLGSSPIKQIANDRRAALDDTFVTITFAPPLPKSEKEAGTEMGPKPGKDLPQGIKGVSITPIDPPTQPASTEDKASESKGDDGASDEEDTSEASPEE